MWYQTWQTRPCGEGRQCHPETRQRKQVGEGDSGVREGQLERRSRHCLEKSVSPGSRGVPQLERGGGRLSIPTCRPFLSLFFSFF